MNANGIQMEVCLMPNMNLTLMTLFCLVFVSPACFCLNIPKDLWLLWLFCDDLVFRPFLVSTLYLHRTSDLRRVFICELIVFVNVGVLCVCVCVWGVNGACAFLFRRLCNTKVLFTLSLLFSHHLSFFFSLYLKELDSRWQKTPKIASMILRSKHKNRSGTSAILTRPSNIWYRTLVNILDHTYRIACLLRQTRECIFES